MHKYQNKEAIQTSIGFKQVNYMLINFKTWVKKHEKYKQMWIETFFIIFQSLKYFFLQYTAKKLTQANI